MNTLFGNITGPDGTPFVGDITLYPISSPMAVGAYAVLTHPLRIPTDSAGHFSTTLAPGFYDLDVQISRVSANPRRRCRFRFPAQASTGPMAYDIKDFLCGDLQEWFGAPCADIGILVPAATPVFNPVSGGYAFPFDLLITSATGTALIYFKITTDGSEPADPDATDTLYDPDNPPSITVPTRVKAIAIATGYENSAIATGSYTAVLAATPVITPTAGSYSFPLTLGMTTTTPGAEIRFTEDGSNPTGASSLYDPLSTPVLSAGATVKAITIAPGYSNSTIATSIFTQLVVADPVFAPSSGGFGVSVNVTLTCVTAGAAIYTTNDDTDPDETDTLFVTGVPIVLTATDTLRAKAFKTGYLPSNVIAKTYTQSALLPVYWGYSSTRILDESGFLALNTSAEPDAFRDYNFDASSTVNDYFHWWFPGTFAQPTATNGFLDLSNSSPLVMATAGEGFTSTVNGWSYLPLTLGGVAGNYYSSFFQLGGGGSFDTRVQ